MGILRARHRLRAGSGSCGGLRRRVVAWLLLLAMLPASAQGAETAPLSQAICDVGGYLVANPPQLGSIGGEWVVLGLARSGYPVPDGYFEAYYAQVEQAVIAKNGALHDRKYTEYARLILALTAMGKDARHVAGYDLTLPLGDYDATVLQGINGPIWALLALDCGDYPMPQNPKAKCQATRQRYLQRILAGQADDGSWSPRGQAGEGGQVDLTAMALQALAKYQSLPAVQEATRRGLTYLSAHLAQVDASAESCAQLVVALGELGIPLDEARFMRDGRTALAQLLAFYQPGAGFHHTPASGVRDQMATEQGFYALVSAWRGEQGLASLYRMARAANGGKTPGVQALPISAPEATFPDLQGHKNRAAIEALAARGVISGKDTGLFDPEGRITRAEVACLLVKALGLAPQAMAGFSDVPGDAWYGPAVGAAQWYGLINGSDGLFRPLGTVTRQEAAVMLANAARLCGIDTRREEAQVQQVLAQCADGAAVAPWARQALAFCCETQLVEPRQPLRPQAPILRCELAQMLEQLLEHAKLL